VTKDQIGHTLTSVNERLFLEDNLKALIKPQYVDIIPRMTENQMTVSQVLDSKRGLNKAKALRRSNSLFDH
jgi:translation initiation factor RLI1